MARTRRRPEVIPPPPSDQALPPETDPDDEEEDQIRNEVGDIAELADPTYRSWTWWVYRKKSDAEMSRDPRGKQRVFCTKVVGPLDVTEIQGRFGGGVFDFWGYFDGRLKMRVEHELEGPVKMYAPVTPPPTPPPVSASSNGPVSSDPMVAMLQGQQRILEAILKRLEAPPPQPQGLTLKDLVMLMPLFQNQGTGTEVIQQMAGLFKMGAEVRGTIEGGGEKNTTEAILSAVVPAVERLATAVMTQRRSGPRPSVARRPVPTSPDGAATVPEADVIEVPPLDIAAARGMAVVDALARAIVRGDDPGDFAATAEAILTDEDLHLMRAASDEQVITQLRQDAGGKYPVLERDDAAAFISAVLAELRSPAPDSEQ